MTRNLVLIVLCGAGAVALCAAQQPSSLAQAQPGLWEIGGAPGASASARMCVVDIGVLARFEHRAKNCNAHIVRAGGTVTVIDYNCGSAGFGHSDVELITPRSLRIATQGISDGLPFNYVLQARRIGECTAQNRH